MYGRWCATPSPAGWESSAWWWCSSSPPALGASTGLDEWWSRREALDEEEKEEERPSGWRASASASGALFSWATAAPTADSGRWASAKSVDEPGRGRSRTSEWTPVCGQSHVGRAPYITQKHPFDVDCGGGLREACACAAAASCDRSEEEDESETDLAPDALAGREWFYRSGRASSNSEDEWEGGESAGSVHLEDDEWESGGFEGAEVLTAQLEAGHGGIAGRGPSGEAKHSSGIDVGRMQPSDIGVSRVGASPTPARALLRQLGDGSPPHDSEASVSDSDEGEWLAIRQEALRSVEEEERQLKRSQSTHLAVATKGPSQVPSTPEGTPGEAEGLLSGPSSDAERLEESLVPNTCVRCGAEVMMSYDAVTELGTLFCCELAGRACEELDVDGKERQVYVQCCAACGESRVLGIDFVGLGLDFDCALAGYFCGAAAASDENPDDNGAVEGDCGEDAELFVQRCSLCGADYAAHIDLVGLGLDFQCSLAGRECWSAATLVRRRTQEEMDIDDGDVEQKAVVLSLVETQRLMSKFGRGYSSKYKFYQPKLEREALKQTLLLEEHDARERYRNNQVVTTKGERWISSDKPKVPMGPGVELAGIIGSGSRGRMGLGLRKMTPDERDRVACSNKERGHLKKKVAHAKNEREIIVFETKGNMHQLVHAAVLPSSAVRPGGR